MIDFIPIFPTMIGRTNIIVDKQSVMSTLITQFDSEGQTGEYEGFVELQTIPDLRHLYVQIANAIRSKMECLHLNPEVYEINFVKSWMNVVREKHTPLHAHYDAHWSWSYYLNVPEGISKPLRFEQTRHPNDPYKGLITYGAQHWDEFNCMVMDFDPQEGDLFIFPSDLIHTTVGYGTGEDDLSINSIEDMLANRICVAGDVIFTHKQKANICLGLQPKSKWISL